MADKEISKEIIIDEKDVKVSDASPIQYAVDIDSPIAARVRKLEEEAVKKKELELRRSEKIRIQQDYLNGMLENVTENLAATEKERSINDALEADVKKQVLSMHGISEDKYEGMQRRTAAVYQGSEFALFFMSVILIIISGFISFVLEGPIEITLFICFFTAIEGTLLNHGQRRSKAAEWVLRIIYFLLFPLMLLVFIMDILGFEYTYETMSGLAVFGVVVLVLGVISYFAYNPYRADKKQLKKAGKYLKNMGKAADKDVMQSIKKAEKQQRREEKELARVEKKEEKRQAKEAKKQEKVSQAETSETVGNTEDTVESDEADADDKTENAEAKDSENNN